MNMYFTGENMTLMIASRTLFPHVTVGIVGSVYLGGLLALLRDEMMDTTELIFSNSARTSPKYTNRQTYRSYMLILQYCRTLG